MAGGQPTGHKLVNVKAMEVARLLRPAVEQVGVLP